MKKERPTEARDVFFPYRVIFLFVAAGVMLVNAGLGAFFLLDEYRVFYDPTDQVMLWALIITGCIVIPFGVVCLFLKKNGLSFASSLLAALVICYVGFYLYQRTDASLSTIALYQGTSLVLPLYMGIFWAVEAKYIKAHKKVVFSKTERQNEEKAPSILD